MKKFFLIALLISYSIASFGVSLNYFYCCGKLKSITLTANHNGGKACKGSKSKRCCKNETVTLKLKVDQKQAFFEKFQLDAPASLPLKPSLFFVSSESIKTTASPSAFFLRPPPPNPASKQALYCIFRI